jgi:protein SCO1/2
MKTLLGVGITGVAFVLFFLFVYRPRAAEARQTTKVDEGLRPSARYYEPALRYVPEFAFTAHTGDTVSALSLKGSVYVVDFFFTSCPAACPMMSHHMTAVQEAFAGVPGFQIVSFSLEPQRDSVPVLRAYAERFGAEEGSWYFLTGEQRAIYALGREHFMLSVQYNGPSDIDHSEKFVLVDPEGGIRGFYQGTNEKEVAQLIKDARYLLNQYDLLPGPLAER